ncbi:MAG: HAD-IA family hydrolase [Actinobacteria bacterium]|nr:HAD-IA family hydrolase [Actinomycetota bacterium]
MACPRRVRRRPRPLDVANVGAFGSASLPVTTIAAPEPAIRHLPRRYVTDCRKCRVLDAIDIPTCVASSGSQEKMRLTLGLTGLRERFEGRIFSADEVERGKPAPDLFLFAAESMGARPEDCFVVEDSPFGAAAASAAGMRALGYAPDHDGAALAREGATVFRSMAELPGLLGDLE